MDGIRRIAHDDDDKMIHYLCYQGFGSKMNVCIAKRLMKIKWSQHRIGNGETFSTSIVHTND